MKKIKRLKRNIAIRKLYPRLTLAAIAIEFGLSKEAVRQVVKVGNKIINQ